MVLREEVFEDGRFTGYQAKAEVSMTSYVVDGPLDLSGLTALYALRRPELKFPVFTPQTPSPLAGLWNGSETARPTYGHDMMCHGAVKL